MHNSPSRKILITAWLTLLALTMGTMISGHVSGGNALGPAWIAALAAITLFKARIILRDYLNLRAASGGWGRGFTAFLILLLGILALLFIIQGLRLLPT